jgi:hypothetical protein
MNLLYLHMTLTIEDLYDCKFVQQENMLYEFRPNALVIYLIVYDSKSYIFWDITPCSPLNANQSSGGTCRPHLQGRRISQASRACFTLDSCLGYSSTLTMEATFFSETSVDVQRTTCHYIPEDKTLHNHR